MALVGRKEMGCASGSGGGRAVNDKMGEGDERNAG